LERRLAFLSLLTDFGIEDGYVGAMKGVIWQIAPDTQIADLTHHIPPQDVFTGSYLLARSGSYFPQGTVHVAVVDPGVGTARRPMAAKLGKFYFVGPDNGLVTFMAQMALNQGETCRYVHLTNKAYWLEQISHVFHGRDIFAPVGAHLCRGVALEELGEMMDDPILLDIPQVQQQGQSILGHVIQIDHFGNLTTDIPAHMLAGKHVANILYQTTNFGRLAQSFGEKAVGDWVAMIDSFNYLSLSIVNGNAASTLHAQFGDPVEVIFEKA
jgi:S-adenosyl-L-methionine hydrolase (adenosine-forming)